MVLKEVELANNDYHIKASIKEPKNTESKTGIILSHGTIINRQSLLRKNNSLGNYLSEKLDAFILAPDVLGDTIHKKGQKFNNFNEIINISSEYFVKKYDLDTLLGFGHSMGSYVLAKAVQTNSNIDAIANYGSPIVELSRGSGFLNYLANYISTYNYNLNIKNVLKHIFDDETCRYLENVMHVEDEFHGENYVYTFDSSIYTDIIKIISNYIGLLKDWGKPTLILLGSEDKVTKTSLKHYKHGIREDNIIFRHAPNASHVTPCMQSKVQLSKLDDILPFYKKIVEVKTQQSVQNNYQYSFSEAFSGTDYALTYC
jgi:hypothetical protein